MADKKLDQEIFAMFANTKMEAQQSYLSRGRTLHGEDSKKLISSWLAQINAWADDKPDFNRQLMDDCEAELGLRGIDAPADQAGDAVEKLAAKSRSMTDNWSLEEADQAEDRVQRQLAKIRPSKTEKN
jgi:hypothetical protein